MLEEGTWLLGKNRSNNQEMKILEGCSVWIWFSLRIMTDKIGKHANEPGTKYKRGIA